MCIRDSAHTIAQDALSDEAFGHEHERRPLVLVGSILAVVFVAAALSLEVALALGIRPSVVALLPRPLQNLIIQAPASTPLSAEVPEANHLIAPAAVPASANAPIPAPRPAAPAPPPIPVALPSPAAPPPAPAPAPIPVLIPLPIPVGSPNPVHVGPVRRPTPTPVHLPPSPPVSIPVQPPVSIPVQPPVSIPVQPRCV